MCVCKTGEKKITLKRPQRVGTVMADQEVLDIANRRTVRKGFQGWPKQMLPPNSAREGLWNWIVEPDYTCALTSMIARNSPALPCTQFQATKATALCLFVVKLRLWASLPCHQVIVCSLLRPSSLHLSHKLGELNHFLPHASVLKTWACKGSRHHFNFPWCKIIKQEQDLNNEQVHSCSRSIIIWKSDNTIFVGFGQVESVFVWLKTLS